jgi:hypothetical protein
LLCDSKKFLVHSSSSEEEGQLEDSQFEAGKEILIEDMIWIILSG